MTVLRLSIALDPATLLARATEGLFPLPAATPQRPWPTLGAWLVLRQGGLRDDLHRLAAEAGVQGWFDPPVCLFAELATRWGVPRPRPLADVERIALLTAVAERQQESVFHRNGNADAWIPAIDRVIGELIAEGITPEAFRAALAERGESRRDPFERDRDERLGRIYDDWHFALRQNDWSDGRDTLVRVARFIDAFPDEFASVLGGRRDLRLVGLADLRGGWRVLLEALGRSSALDTVTLLASHRLELPPTLTFDVIDDMCTQETGASTFARQLFPVSAELTPPAMDLRGMLHLLEAPDAAREIEQVALRVRALVDGGTAPHRIAVTMRQARPGVDRMASALDTLGVPVTARRRTALAHTGPARAIRALLNAAAENFSRHAVVEVAEHPLLSFTLNADVLFAAGQSAPNASLEAWSPSLDRLLERCRHRDATPDDWRANRGVPATSRVESTIEAWQRWLPTARSLVPARVESAWFAWVEAVLTDSAWGVTEALAKAPAGDSRVWRAEVTARDRTVAVAREWVRALREVQSPDVMRDAATFARRLALALNVDTVAQPESGFGVVVAEALATGWRSVDHLFVVGLSAGEFPRRQQPSPLLGARDREALIHAGLPLDRPDAWRGREQELFRVLCAAPCESLTLSWPSMDGSGRGVARSSYVDEVIDTAVAAIAAREGADEADDEESRVALLVAHGLLTRMPTQQVLTPGFPLVARGHEDEAVAHATFTSAIERERSGALSPYNGDIEDDATVGVLAARFGEQYSWSATKLEELAKCGWSWFAHRLLRLEDRGDLDDGMAATTRGTILHEALDGFFKAMRHANDGRPVCLRTSMVDSAFPVLTDAFERAWTAQRSQAWLGDPALHEVVRAELLGQLRRYVKFEAEFNDSTYNNRTNASKQIRMAVSEGELEFRGVSLEADGVRFRLDGKIDRVDMGIDERVTDAGRFFAAIDYKSTVYSTPAAGNKKGWADGVVLQVPLYAKALGVVRPEQQLARLEYRTLRRPEAVHTLDFLRPAKPKNPKRPEAGEPELVDGADERLDSAMSHAARRVLMARHGEFAAAPAPSCGCSPYCVARDICRVPGGPREAAK